MRLRTRILLAYGFLIALVLLAAGSAVIGFFDLGSGIEKIREEHIRSVRETTRLIEALERQDSATLTRLLESDGDDDGEELSDAEAQFREAFDTLEERAESQETQTTLEGIDHKYREYREARTSLLEEPPRRPLSAYREHVSPKFRAVKSDVMDLLHSNHEAIARADRDAQSRALKYGSWIGFLVVVALFAFVFLTRKLRINFLDRLSQIRDVAEAVESGDRRRRVAVDRNDELGTVARELNRALDRYQQIESRLEGRERELKQLVLGVLDQFDAPVTLYGPDGQTVATTLSNEAARAIPTEALSAIVERGGELFRSDDPSSGERLDLSEYDIDADIEVVETPGGRPVGWIAVFRSLALEVGEDNRNGSGS